MLFPLQHRPLLFSFLLLGCVFGSSQSPAQVSFQSHQVTQNTDLLEVSGHGDFNNDGREDLMVLRFTQSTTGLTTSSELYLSSGDGTYQAPIPLPGPVSPQTVVVGDFNHDGKLDFANITSQISVYLGNGDGTFQPAKAIAGSNLPQAVGNPLVALDLNHDGKTDLVQIAGGSTPALQLWISNGDGTFSKGQTLAPYNPQSSGFLSGAVAGDFDGDGKPDIAVLYSYEGPTTVQVWYGDGAGHLGSPFTMADSNSYDDPQIVAADVNNDGRSDLVSRAFVYGVDGTSQFLPKLALFSGNANRTLSYSDVSTSQCPYAASVADFNGDGVNDLAYWEGSCSSIGGGNTSLVVKSGQGSGTFGAEQTISQSVYGAYDLTTLRSSLGTKPDLLFDENTVQASPGGFPAQSLVLLSNDSAGSFPACSAPSTAEGLSICAPGATANAPVRFSIGAAGPTPMRAVEVWADGKKVAFQSAHAFSNYAFLDASVPLAAGTHSIAVYGTGWDDTLQKKTFTLQVGGGSCAAPSSAGVDICSPVSGSTVSSPVSVSAAGKVNGTFARFEVWVDGMKKFTSTTQDGANLSLPLTAGSHTFSFYAVNTAGTKWNKTSTVTVH